MKKIVLVLFLLSMSLAEGCAVAGASALGYLEADSKYKKLYAEYEQKQDEAGQPAKGYKEWLKDQPLSRREIKIYRMYGTISEEEAKDINVEEEQLEDLERLE